jgi:hypothetical protein
MLSVVMTAINYRRDLKMNFFHLTVAEVVEFPVLCQDLL